MAEVSLGTGNLSYGGAVVQTSGGVRYAVFGVSNNSLAVCKNIDGTPSSVTNTSTQISGTASAISGVAAAIDGNDDIHIVVQGYTSAHTRDIAYCIYDTGTDAFGTWEQAAPILNTPLGSVARVSIAFDSSDKPHVVYTDEEAGSSYTNIKYTNKVSGSWLSAETVSVTTTNNYRFPQIRVRNSDIVEVLYYNNNLGNAVYRTRTSGSWGSETDVYDGTSPDTHGITSTTGGTVYRYTSSGSDIRENGTDTTRNKVSYAYAVAASLASTTRILLYHDVSASAIYVSTTTNGTWSEPSSVKSSTNYHLIGDYAYHHWNAGPGRINYIYGTTSAVYADYYDTGVSGGGGEQTVSLNAIASTAQVYQVTVQPGAVTVTLNTIASAATVYQPAVQPGSVTVSLNTIASTATVYQVTVTQAQTVSLNTIASTATVYQPAVSVGAVTVSLNTITSTAQVYQPAVTPGAVTVSLNAIASTATVHQPAVQPGAVTVSLNTISSTAVVYQPTVIPGGQTVELNTIPSTAQVYQPAVSVGAVTVALDAIASAAQVFPVTVQPGAVTVSLNAIASTAIVYEPEVFVGFEQTVELAHIASAATVYAPTVTSTITVALGTIGSTAQVFPVHYILLSIVTAAVRTHTVGAESRAGTVAAESRIVNVAAESRTITVGG